MRIAFRVFNFNMFLMSPLLIALLVLHSSILAENSNIGKNVQGIWYQPNESEPGSFVWKAAWIWEDEAMEADAILARRSYELNSVPSEAFLRISASSKYKLYIN